MSGSVSGEHTCGERGTNYYVFCRMLQERWEVASARLKGEGAHWVAEDGRTLSNDDRVDRNRTRTKWEETKGKR